MGPTAPVAPPPLRCAQLADAEWGKVGALLPPQGPLRGRPRHERRTILGGVRWVLRTASLWREMPARLGNWDAACAR